MASLGELSIQLRANNEITPELNLVNATLKTTEHKWKSSGATINGSNEAMARTLARNRVAVRQLAQGVGYLGTSFLSMGVMLKSTKTALGETAGNTMIMVGSMMTAVSSSLQFISAIGNMIKALRALQIQQILTQAFSGPAGWATLAAGAAVAGVTIAATNQKVAKASSEKGQSIIINNRGPVNTQIAADVRQNNIKVNQRSAGAGWSSP